MTAGISRRDWLVSASAAVGTVAAAGALLPATTLATEGAFKDPFGYCLNTSTISGQKLSLPEEVDLTAKVGYQAIEPWIRELDQFVKDGGSLKDLAKRIRDQGLRVESAIGFCDWIVDDNGRRQKGIEEARRSMDLVQQIGGKRLAAPPVGATNQADMPLGKIAERYRALLELGDKMDVVPQLELWGFSKTLSRLSETAYVAIETGHPRACILTDVYHLYKGGSDFSTLKLLGPSALQHFHINDYPAKPARAEINDAHRVYPGDGVAPLKSVLRDLRALGFRGLISLELFNRDYWKQDATLVARTGLEKMKAVTRASLG